MLLSVFSAPEICNIDLHPVRGHTIFYGPNTENIFLQQISITFRIRLISVLPVQSLRIEQAPVLPPLRCLHMLVNPLHLDHGALHGLPVAVLDCAVND